MTSIAYLAIQCAAPCGAVGDFLFTGDTLAEAVAVSPVFNNALDIWDWAENNGWTKKQGFDRAHPTGVWLKTAGVPL